LFKLNERITFWLFFIFVAKGRKMYTANYFKTLLVTGSNPVFLFGGSSSIGRAEDQKKETAS